MPPLEYTRKPKEPEFFPFSLVLGKDFRRSPDGGALSQGDRRLREKLSSLVGPADPRVMGRFVVILAEGQIRFRDIPEIEPHIRRGVTFHDPQKLYDEWASRGNVGYVFGNMMLSLIENASKPRPTQETHAETQVEEPKAGRFSFLRPKKS